MPRTSSPRTSPWRTPADKAAEREEKRNAVLNAAAAAFAQNGYHGTSLDEIATRLGVSKPTIYYYARNKDDLVAAIADRGMASILAAAQGDEQATALAQIQHLIRVYAETMTTDAGRCVLVLRHAGSGPASEAVRAYMRHVDERLRTLLELGAQDGSIARCDTKLTAFMIAGALNGIAQWFDGDGAMSASLVAEKFANQLTAGLAPRS
jgi:AcrR family transcriptional regulator